MRAFFRQGDKAVSFLYPHERAVLSTVVSEVTDLLSEGTGEGSLPDVDPVFERLFPDAAPSDPDISEEFRRLTEADLRSLKVDRLKTIQDELSADRPEWTVPLEDGLATAAALTDLRLVIASRLGLETDEDATLLAGEFEVAQGLLDVDLPEGLKIDHERLWFSAVYQALTFLQDSLVTCLMDTKGGNNE